MIVVESKQDHCLFSPREVGFDLIRDFLIMEAFTTKKTSVNYAKREGLFIYYLMTQEKSLFRVSLQTKQCELLKERRDIYALPCNDTQINEF